MTSMPTGWRWPSPTPPRPRKQVAAGNMNRAANEALRVCEILAKDTVNRPKTANPLPPLRRCCRPKSPFFAAFSN